MNLEQPDVAKLEEAANLAARATQAAVDKVAELESQLAAARSDLEAAKEREMEALQFLGSDGGSAAPVVSGAKTGRNDPCPCGSGKKYKKCHGS